MFWASINELKAKLPIAVPLEPDTKAAKAESPNPVLALPAPRLSASVPAAFPIIVLAFASVTLNVEVVEEFTNSTVEPEFKVALLENIVNEEPDIDPVSPAIVTEPPDGNAATPNWLVEESIVTAKGVPLNVLPFIPDIKVVNNCLDPAPVPLPMRNVWDSERTPTLFI